MEDIYSELGYDIHSNLKRLNDKLAYISNGIFNRLNEHIIVQLKDRVDLSVPLARPVDAKQLMEELPKELEASILFVTKEHTEERWSIVGFSKPTADKMYIFYIKSMKNRTTKNVFFVLYSSSDDMYRQLKELLNSIQGEEPLDNVSVVQKMSEVELRKLFM